MPPRSLALRADHAIKLDGLLIGGGVAEHCTAEHASDVRVGESRRLAECEARDRRRRVRADPGKSVESGDGSRQARGVRPRDTMQVPRAAVVAKARPLAENLAEWSAGERSQRREPPEKPPVRGQNAGDLRLLQHHLADENAVRIARAAPGKVAAGPPVPGEDAPTKRRRNGQADVQFPEQKSTPVEC